MIWPLLGFKLCRLLLAISDAAQMGPIFYFKHDAQWGQTPPFYL